MARNIRLEIVSEGFVFSPSLVLFAEYVCFYLAKPTLTDYSCAS